MMIRTVLLVFAFVAAALAQDRPNVVLVMTDDQGYGDLSCHGNPVLKTPNLDALSGVSVRLADYHVSPTCSPTRSALLTGHWTNRTGVWHTIMGRSILRADEVTVGQVFKDAGYATGMFGKWHLGDSYPYRPEDRGFQEVMRHGGGGVGQTPDFWDNAYFDGSYWHNGVPEPVKGYCTDVFFDYAKRFIKQQKDAQKPFFAYIATNAPHGPLHSPASASAPYVDQGEAVANFFGMIANIDENVGALRDFLRAEGLEENTLFIFTTDNGTASGQKVHNAGMRGNKGSPYDGGHRVPCFFYWPKGALNGGRDVTQITAHVDLMPTLIDLCGLPAPAGVRFDGTSLKPLLQDHVEDWPDRLLVTDSQRVPDPIKWRQSAVMSNQWRLINGKELYDIKKDPGQADNIAKGHPEVMKRMRSFYEDWWSELEPTFAAPIPIYLGHAEGNPTTLTCHDWIAEGTTPWNQADIRRALNGKENTGYWNVNIVAEGEYEIALRRWPKEADVSIDAALPPGAAVPGSKAFRMTPGKAIKVTQATLRIGQVTASAAVGSGAKEVVFDVKLSAGQSTLSATFATDDGQEFGAYYVYVRKR